MKNSTNNEMCSMREHIIKTDKLGEITAQASLARLSIDPTKTLLSDELCRAIDSAQIDTWTAFTLHDKSIDTNDYSKISEHESLLLIKDALNTYQKIGLDASVIERYFDRAITGATIEKINTLVSVTDTAITLTQQSLEEFNTKNTFERAAIHILPSILVFNNIDMRPADTDRILSPYVIARQISDDLYDWREDLHNGRITYVVNWLCKEARLEPGSYNLFDILPEFKSLFFARGIEELSLYILDNLLQTSDALKNTGVFSENPALLTQIIEPLSKKAQSWLLLNQKNRARIASLKRTPITN